MKELWNHTILLLIEKLWNNKFNFLFLIFQFEWEIVNKIYLLLIKLKKDKSVYSLFKKMHVFLILANIKFASKFFRLGKKCLKNTLN